MYNMPNLNEINYNIRQKEYKNARAYANKHLGNILLVYTFSSAALRVLHCAHSWTVDLDGPGRSSKGGRGINCGEHILRRVRSLHSMMGFNKHHPLLQGN